jgi:hypothetical protein
MAQVIINDGESGLVVRTALNAMFTELYALTYQIKDADGDTILSVEPSADADYGQLTVPAEVGTTAFKINNGIDDIFDVSAKGALSILDALTVKARAAGSIGIFKNASDVINFDIKDTGKLYVNNGNNGLVWGGTENVSILNLAATMPSGIQNTLVGHLAGKAITIGDANTILGASSGNAITSAGNNALFGTSCKITGNHSGNSIFGAFAGQLATGSNNSLFGNRAGLSAISNNIAMGYQAGYNAVSYGISLGYTAGRYETSSNTLLIGSRYSASLTEAAHRKEAVFYGNMNPVNSSQHLQINADTTIQQHQTLTAGVTNSNLGSLIFAPEYIVEDAGSHTVTRHNYIKIKNPVETETLGTITITDTAVLEFDDTVANHKALIAGTNNGALGANTDAVILQGTLLGMMKVNFNGTIGYVPVMDAATYYDRA